MDPFAGGLAACGTLVNRRGPEMSLFTEVPIRFGRWTRAVSGLCVVLLGIGGGRGAGGDCRMILLGAGASA